MNHPDYDWYVGTPDGLILDDDGKIIGGVDYKTTGYAKKDDWGEPGTDEVPAYYHTQAMWYMGLTGAQWWDIAVLFMGARREFKIYRINRDEELIATLIEKGKEFWEQYVIPQIPPSVDASPGWSNYFKKMWPKEQEDLIEVPKDEEADVLMHNLRVNKDDLSEIQREIDEIENKIKKIIGLHAGIKSPTGKITWKATKDRTVVDWEAAFNELTDLTYGLISNDIIYNIQKKFTTNKPGPRVFRTYFNKEKD